MAIVQQTGNRSNFAALNMSDIGIAEHERQAMQVSVNVECTPEEARTFLGLPDVSPIHEKYVQTMLETMGGTINTDQMENLFRSFSPMGDAGMRLFKQMMDLGLSGGGTVTKKEG